MLLFSRCRPSGHGRTRAESPPCTDGVLIDWAANDLLYSVDCPERQQFLLGDQWLGLDHHVYEERHVGIPEREPWSESHHRPLDACAANRHRSRSG